MVVKLEILLKQAELQGAIGATSSILEAIGQEEDPGVITNSIAGFGIRLCTQEEKLVRDNKLADYDISEVELELPDSLMIQSHEEILKQYDDMNADEVVKDILDKLKEMEEE